MTVGDSVHHVEAAVLATGDKPDDFVLDSGQLGRRICSRHDVVDGWC